MDTINNIRLAFQAITSAYPYIKLKLLTLLLICISVCSQGQVRLGYFGDTLKGNIKRMTEYRREWSEFGDTLKVVYSYDAEQCMEMATFDPSLHNKWLVKYGDNGGIIETSLYCDPAILCEKTTYIYDAHGRKIEEYSFDSSCDACHWFQDRVEGGITEWITGEFASCTSGKYLYDAQGRLVQIKTVQCYKPNRYDTIIEITAYSYDGNSNRIAEMRKEAISIWPGRTDTTVEITSYKYDTAGNKTEEDLLKKDHDKTYKSWISDGKEITLKISYKYDSRNNLLERRCYFPEEHDPYSSQQGMQIGATDEYTYDSLNKMTSGDRYDLYRQNDGTETKVPSLLKLAIPPPEDKGRKEYDAQGNIIRESYGGKVSLRREIEYF